MMRRCKVQAPPVGIIKMAIDRLEDVDYINAHQDIFIAQYTEFRLMLPHEMEAVYDGYKLGLEVARLMKLQCPTTEFDL
jgi:hypothetical protein